MVRAPRGKSRRNRRFGWERVSETNDLVQILSDAPLAANIPASDVPTSEGLALWHLLPPGSP